MERVRTILIGISIRIYSNERFTYIRGVNKRINS